GLAGTTDIEHGYVRRQAARDRDVRPIDVDLAGDVQSLTGGPLDGDLRIQVGGDDVARNGLGILRLERDVHRNAFLQDADRAADGDIAGRCARGEFLDAQHSLIARDFPVDVREISALYVVAHAAAREAHRPGDLRVGCGAGHLRVDLELPGYVL